MPHHFLTYHDFLVLVAAMRCDALWMLGRSRRVGRKRRWRAARMSSNANLKKQTNHQSEHPNSACRIPNLFARFSCAKKARRSQATSMVQMLCGRRRLSRLFWNRLGQLSRCRLWCSCECPFVFRGCALLMSRGGFNSSCENLLRMGLTGLELQAENCPMCVCVCVCVCVCLHTHGKHGYLQAQLWHAIDGIRKEMER